MAPHLTFEERRIFAGLLHRKVGVAQIAIQLGRYRLTIYHEFRRNFWHAADGYGILACEERTGDRSLPGVQPVLDRIRE
ncbi:helix-turn-helix domain-containing protein [Paracoccus laeviglucosivorans]|uniref:Helix-turn-helix domain-containing protein n=1 Tax=Paracoccus laeviglucosivorans TaxID=1197861 RepID=A0A521FU48_9RHOB|nr:helix-turn-helix domain-containing protein [Paracoccus laeviglucosivorans]SMO99061.1 Helix-turn-helix domain-containing protein [Paracoccus laeviglucosivorans]